ncbi:MAG: carbamoyltransferase C-terminal domain-containing protein [Bryobacteraceae bacterium]
MIIVGIGGGAAALIKDGTLAAAVEQVKVTRTSSRDLPLDALDACLRIAKVDAAAVNGAVLVRPFRSPADGGVHVRLRGLLPGAEVAVLDHHTAHAASAYYASPFENATVLTLDRHGDMRCGARWLANGAAIELDRELYPPDSLGDLYSRVTALLGYQPNVDEHKVQWLSASGDDRFTAVFQEILHGNGDPWPRIDLRFFDTSRHSAGGFAARFYKALGLSDEAEVPAHLRPHVAAGLQRAIEATVLAMAGSGENLCLAGGLGLNALLVASLEQSGKWKNVFVQPAAGNSGTAIGAALHGWHRIARRNERIGLGSLCLGPAFSAEESKQVLENCKLRFRYMLTAGELVERAVAELDDNRIIAWMQGAMEFGSRALGNRSILASPRNPYSTENLNSYIKHREGFRKFAASVPAELAGEFFETGPNARFLATVGRVKPAHRKTFDSAVLGDGLVRVHTVSKEDNPLFWELLHAAGKATGLPVLYNTSFNLFGDPLVCSPRDAVRSFYSSGIDAMFVGNFFLEK